MHNFQPYPMNMLEWNPMEKISKEWFAITTEVDGKPNAMTAGWGGIGHIWGKNAVFIFVRESRYTKELLDNSDTFSCCFFDPNEKSSRSTLKILGSISGRSEDKIKECRLDINHMMGIPFIDQSNFAILCKKMAAVNIDPDDFTMENINPDWYKDGDYHTMYIGQIVDILAR